MKFVYCFLLVLLIAVPYQQTTAQNLKENEIVVIQGEKFVLHQVRTGETIYSLCKYYGVDNEELHKYNPQISESFNIGDILKIPYNDDVNFQNVPVSRKGDPVSFEFYTVTSRTQTPYFISRQFDITVEELYAYNPEVTRFKKGTRLRIPVWGAIETVQESIPETVPEQSSETEVVLEPAVTEGEKELIMHEVKSGETLYSISRKYDVSESEIVFFNPSAKELKTGSVLYIPKKVKEPEFKSPLHEISGKIDEELTAAQIIEERFFEHTIVSGETLWSVSRKYNVSENQLKQLNPVLEEGFPAGTIIKVPVAESVLTTAEPANEDAFLRHEVMPGENLYRLSVEYDISVPEIRRFNPQLETRNLVSGETILIPRKPEADEEVEAEPEAEPEIFQEEEEIFAKKKSPFDDAYYDIEIPVTIPEQCRPSPLPEEIYNVALFLPLFVTDNLGLNPEANEDSDIINDFVPDNNDILQDTLIERDIPEKTFYNFYRDSENYFQFYEGVLLAVDSMRSTGMNINLNIIDTKLSNEELRRYIYSPGFLETDLIIGPALPQDQNEIASIAAKNRIPMVSPLSSQSGALINSSNYYQINPSRDLIISKTAELITEDYFNSNFVVVKTANSAGMYEEKVVDIVRERMQNSGFWNKKEGMQYQLYDYGREKAGGLTRVLSPEKENVIFVLSMDEGDLSVILSNLNNLVGKYPITLIGFNRYEQFESISPELFFKLKLHYLAPYWTDYSHPATIRVVDKFKENFYVEPGNFGMQGYDVAFYFLNALFNYGKKFEDCLLYQRLHLSQGNYCFEKTSQFGGYMNHGVSVVSYEPTYDVVRKRVLVPFGTVWK